MNKTKQAETNKQKHTYTHTHTHTYIQFLEYGNYSSSQCTALLSHQNCHVSELQNNCSACMNSTGFLDGCGNLKFENQTKHE